MSIFDKLKREPSLDPAAQADAEAAANRPEPEGAKEAADRELPSVNAKKKGGKITGWAAMLFIGALGLFLIWQLNTGQDRKARAEQKARDEMAKANAISGTLPAITLTFM